MNKTLALILAGLLTGCATDGSGDRWAMVLTQGLMGIAAANAYGSSQWAQFPDNYRQAPDVSGVSNYTLPGHDAYHAHPGADYSHIRGPMGW